MDISFDGQYDRKTFMQALRLVQHTSWGDRALRIAALGLALILFGAAWYGWVKNNRLEYYQAFLFIPLLLYATAPWLSAWWTTYRLFRERPTRSVSGRANAQGITLLSKMAPGKQRHIPWEAFQRAGHGPNLIGLLTRDGTLWVLRSDFFASHNQWMAFQKLVKKHILEPQRKR